MLLIKEPTMPCRVSKIIENTYTKVSKFLPVFEKKLNKGKKKRPVIIIKATKHTSKSSKNY